MCFVYLYLFISWGTMEGGGESSGQEETRKCMRSQDLCKRCEAVVVCEEEEAAGERELKAAAFPLLLLSSLRPPFSSCGPVGDLSDCLLCCGRTLESDGSDAAGANTPTAGVQGASAGGAATV